LQELTRAVYGESLDVDVIDGFEEPFETSMDPAIVREDVLDLLELVSLLLMVLLELHLLNFFTQTLEVGG
jgi:hypothetical protein